jgi:LmbE family N-acetylglucosaminyl deacetylase
MKALFLSPHTDDAVLGCGAFLARTASKCETWHVALSTCDNAKLLYESVAANKYLRALQLFEDYERRQFKRDRQHLLQKLISYRKKINPDLVVIPEHDCHQDHQAVYEEALRVFKNCTILAYVLPWNIVDGNGPNYNYFVPIDETELLNKITALQQYETQKDRHYMHPDFIRSWARTTGTICGHNLAEGLRIVRMYADN